MKRLLLLFGFAILIDSCSNFKSNEIIDSLIGTWTLDSTSYPNGKIYDNKDLEILSFVNKTDYSHEWWKDDVGNTSTGKFFVLNNPKRGLMTLTCIPDIQVSGTDTFRIQCMNMDIVSIQSDRLILIDEDQWVKRYSSPTFQFNKVYIYKRRK